MNYYKLSNHIKEKEREIKVLKEELEELKFPSFISKDVKEIAELIHEILCNGNHTDECFWYYETWGESNGGTRNRYVSKAKYLIKCFDYNIENTKKYLKDFLYIKNTWEIKE